jgi:glycosyltransferase involved in cell wall biosynthesis
MRICLVGDFSEQLDEGFKNVTRYLEIYLSREHQLLRLDLKRPIAPTFWFRDLPRPDVIHYVTAPTLLTFALLGLLRLRWPTVPSVVSVLHPSSFRLEGSKTLRCLISLSRPTLLLVQASRSAAMFCELGCRIAFLPNGVGAERFVPVSPEERRKLRNKYGLDQGRFIVLHVGHLSRKRNIQLMSQLQTDGAQVLIVGSTYLGEDQELSAEMERRGCIVWKGYIPQIEEIYTLADCFVFPTPLGGSLFMPLSVMEAMACNLPVISTPFEGLVHYFQPGEGLVFADEGEIPQALVRWRQSGASARTRRQVEPFSWDRVVKQLGKIYKSVVEGEGT